MTKIKEKFLVKLISLLILFVPLFFSCVSTKGLDKTTDSQNKIDKSIDKDTTTDTDKTDKTDVTDKTDDTSKKVVEKTSEITLLFAGDIMAHKPNYVMKGYDKIWKGVSSEISRNDIAFANIEAPVDNTIPWSTYPNFNMHSEYIDEAIKAGFSVFSLVNNHSNDQGLSGIKNTIKWSTNLEQKTAKSENPIYFSGLKNSPESPFTYCIIEKNDWKILFVAVTEILNSMDSKSYLNYTPYTEKGREEFISYVKNLRNENPCDLFILSIHTNEEEYVAPVKQKRREYFKTLLENGADVIWANHPHIIRERDIYGEKSSGNLKKIVMYGNGNTISGQRWEPQLENPFNAREDTGDGLMMRVTFSKKTIPKSQNNVIISKKEPVYITTYINPNWEFVINTLDSPFIQHLKDSGKNSWASYLQSRKGKAESTKETIIWE